MQGAALNACPDASEIFTLLSPCLFLLCARAPLFHRTFASSLAHSVPPLLPSFSNFSFCFCGAVLSYTHTHTHTDTHTHSHTHTHTHAQRHPHTHTHTHINTHTHT